MSCFARFAADKIRFESLPAFIIPASRPSNAIIKFSSKNQIVRPVTPHIKEQTKVWDIITLQKHTLEPAS
jgi:hypothetical protein